MPEDFTQLTAIGIITIFLIKEMFAFLKTRKGNNGVSMDFKLINYKLDNHITTISKEITNINEEMRDMKRDVADIKLKLK